MDSSFEESGVVLRSPQTASWRYKFNRSSPSSSDTSEDCPTDKLAASANLFLMDRISSWRDSGGLHGKKRKEVARVCAEFMCLNKELELSVGEKERTIGVLRQHTKGTWMPLTSRWRSITLTEAWCRQRAEHNRITQFGDRRDAVFPMRSSRA